MHTARNVKICSGSDRLCRENQWPLIIDGGESEIREKFGVAEWSHNKADPGSSVADAAGGYRNLLENLVDLSRRGIYARPLR
ncbi:Uncharacterized protein DBV15_00116 [Temnothorax longispinosus]|uniref:Uncharacterized protein n=1 Tax=Temnothorax longispinosus TaxID=300112 RepID=A0A4S2KHJ5_9HYME|nr:Uncharacterized protein DBV15_00116 [Temnothorax longispinosus]